MRALVIAPQPFFSPRGTPFSVYYRTLVTARLGVQIDLLTYGEGQNVDIPGVRIVRIPRFGFLGPVKIGPSPLKLFLDVFMLVWTIALLCRRRYHFVHAHEEAVFWCRFLKPIFRFKLVYDMHSSLPQQLTNFRFTTSKLLIGIFAKLERSALRTANATITICPDLADQALGMGVDPDRHLLIENSIFENVRLAAPSESDQPPTSDAQVTPTVDSEHLIVYAGTFESYQGIDILIRAFGRVHEKRGNAHLLMVGGDPQQIEQMKSLAGECELDGAVTFTGRVAKGKAMAYLEQAHVLVSPRREGTNTPLKVYEQLASGKPLVATNIWSHTQVLDDRVCYLVEPTPESMAEGLLAALEDDQRRRDVVAAAKQLYAEKYSYPVYEGKMRRLLEVIG